MSKLTELIAAVSRDLYGKKAVLGISGGKDSSIAAAVLSIALGKENVLGISMPNGEGIEDKPYVDMLEEALKIDIRRINIKPLYDAALEQMAGDGKVLTIKADTLINLPARIRMTMLFAFAQSIENARVINTCNLSEDMMGYSTLFGDLAGSYALLKPYTVTEIRDEIGMELCDQFRFPEELVYRTPSDGLCGSTDEEKMGMTYADIDRYVRTGTTRKIMDKFHRVVTDSTLQEAALIYKIRTRYEANKFKLSLVNIPGPSVPNPGRNFILFPTNGETY